MNIKQHIKTIDIMEERWIESLRKRYADRQSTVPKELWDDITLAMNGGSVPGKSMAKAETKGRRFLYRSRMVAAVAACIVVIVGIWFFSGNDFSRDVSISGKNPVAENVATGSGSDVDMADDRSVGMNIYKVTTGMKKLYKAVMADDDDGSAEDAFSPFEEENAVTSDAKKEEKDYDTGRSAKVAVTGKPQKGKVRNDGHLNPSNDLLAFSGNKNNGSTISFGIYGATPASFGSGTGNGKAYMRAMNMPADAIMGAEYMKAHMLSYENILNVGDGGAVKAKHRQPVKFGASVRIGLNDKIGIETGLSYSYLSSDISTGDEFGGYKTEQRLHYIGIPLNLSYNVWGNDRFDVYVSGGGAVDFCVSGKSETETFSGNAVTSKATAHYRDTRPQWSVNASVGAQYKLNDMFSLYAEPGVGYYLDNGSDVMTIYKDKPFNFNLNFGLRLSVK